MWPNYRHIFDRLSPEPEDEYPVFSSKRALENIIKFLSVRDIKACSMVSKFWRECSQSALASSTLVKIPCDSKIFRFLNFLENLQTKETMKLYSNYSVTIDFDKTRPFQSFWVKCGEHIKFLELSDCQFPNKDTFRQIIFKLCPNLEQLKMSNILVLGDNTLDLPVANFFEDEILEHMFTQNCKMKRLEVESGMEITTGITWMEILSHYPCLEELKLRRGQVSRSDGQHYNVFRAVKLIRLREPARLKLKRIGQHLNIDYAAVFLVDSGLTLDGISLALDDEKSSGKLRHFLARYGTSLKKLSLRGASNDLYFHPEECFPQTDIHQVGGQLLNLEELELHSRVFTSMEVLKYTPNLKKLSLKQHMLSTANIISCSGEVQFCHKNCRELEVVGKSLSEEEIRILARLLPNLKSIIVPLNSEYKMMLLCRRWREPFKLRTHEAQLELDEITSDPHIWIVSFAIIVISLFIMHCYGFLLPTLK